jgi:type I restriction enzyme M protein
MLDVSGESSRSGYYWTAFDVSSRDIVAEPNLRLDLKYWNPVVRQQIAELLVEGGMTVSELNQIETNRGVSPTSHLYVDATDGFAVVIKAGSNVSPFGEIIIDNADYVEKSVYDDLPPRCKIQKHDVLVSSTGDGTLGKAAVYNLDLPAVADGHVTIVRVSPEVDPQYLADYLRCGFGADQIQRAYTGSTGLIELTPDDVDSIVIDTLRGVTEQRARSRSLRTQEAQYRRQLDSADTKLVQAREKFRSLDQ